HGVVLHLVRRRRMHVRLPGDHHPDVVRGAALEVAAETLAEEAGLAVARRRLGEHGEVCAEHDAVLRRAPADGERREEMRVRRGHRATLSRPPRGWQDRAMHVLIYGTGAVGGYFGALLATGGHDVTFVARGANLDALRRAGLRVLLGGAERVIELPQVRAVERPVESAPADLVLVCVKSYGTPAAAAALHPVA